MAKTIKDLYRGSNRQSTASLFGERKKYKNFALVKRNFNSDLPSANIEAGVADFSMGHLCLYGKVDKDNDIILLNRGTDKLKKINPLPTMKSNRVKLDPGSTSMRAINFVVDAFHQFMREFVKAQKNVCNGVAADEIKIEVVRALVHPGDLYGEHIMGPFRTTFGSYLTMNPAKGSAKKLRDEVETFEQYMDKLLAYVEYAGTAVPLTTVGYVSRYGTIASTGLSIELRDANPSHGVTKGEFINENVFDLYKKAANKHGFIIDKSMPWRLVADINSAAMQEYMANYEITLDNFFESYYTKIHRVDMLDISALCYNLWNNYVQVAPKFLRRVDTRCNTGKVITEMVERREFKDWVSFANVYDYKYWISVVVQIRNSELGRPFKGVQLDRIVTHSQEIFRAKGRTAAVDYINSRLKDEALKQTINPARLLPDPDTKKLWAELSTYDKLLLKKDRTAKFTS